MRVIATAGHVDHGKTALLRALTGMETDRLPEERRRGMTIELGYAWTTLPGGETAAFVDVPGHERFLTTMLAGVGPAPAALLAVAADGGWARQTEEHLAALDALGVRYGVLAVTRADLADPAPTVAAARERLAGSSLAAVEIVETSAVTGQGMERLRETLAKLVARMPVPDSGRPARLWVDRVFTVQGAGTVVTGTLGSGSIAVGDELRIASTGRTVRVRSMESLKTTVSGAAAVSRVALNLRGSASSSVRRGQALISSEGWTVTGELDVRLTRVVERLPNELVFHLGSAAIPVRLRPLGSDTARLRLAGPVAVHQGERGVIRAPGNRKIIVGAVVLDVLPPPLNRRGAAAARSAALADVPDLPEPALEVARLGAVTRSRLLATGVLPTGSEPALDAVTVGDWLVHPRQWDTWKTRLRRVTDQWASEHPLTPGMSRETAMRELALPDPGLLDALVGEAGLVHDATGVHRAGARPALPEAVERAMRSIRDRLTEAPFGAPSVDELLSLGLTERHLAAAARNGLLLRLPGSVVLLPDAPQVARQRLSALPEPFTLSQARQALGTTRRVAVPLLELMDRTGLTKRIDATHRRCT
ncbi:selenocysteine-specific translation elongation factor [Streptomyces sp. NPDC050416]|uniref:selenocysteine-specific translation elongation factor n=1 Tax=Streptomyces sp. NPDC050416 TaxID=3365611 RepID=UPI00379CCA2D